MSDQQTVNLGLILLVASVVAMASRRMRLPYSVGLVAAGILLALAPINIGIPLSADGIFTVLLPPLIFEAALQIRWPPCQGPAVARWDGSRDGADPHVVAVMEFPGAKPKVGNLALAPELVGTVSATVDELERAIQLAELQRDPLRHVLKALATHLKSLHRVLTDATLTIGNQLEEARRPIAEEDIRRLSKASADGAWRATAGLVRAHIWRSILIAVAASLLLLIGAFGAGYWFRGDQQLVAGVSAGQQECHEQQGGTICFIPVWAKLPPAQVP